MLDHLTLSDDDFIDCATINELSRFFHSEAEKWWRDPKTNEFKPRPFKEMLMLQVSEIAEAMEGVRKGLKDDHLPAMEMEEVELADFLIRFFDMLGAYRITISPKRWDSFTFTPIHFFETFNPASNLYELVEILDRFKTVLLDPESRDGWDDRGMFRADLVSSTVRNHTIEFAALSVIRAVELYAFNRDLDLIAAMKAKAEYNRNRADHKHSERMKDGGKKF